MYLRTCEREFNEKKIVICVFNNFVSQKREGKKVKSCNDCSSRSHVQIEFFFFILVGAEIKEKL